MSAEKSTVTTILAAMMIAIVQLAACHDPAGTGTELQNANADCVGCHRQRLRAAMTEDEMRILQIDIIKMKILRGLNLETPPVVNTTQHRSIPEPMRSELFRNVQHGGRPRRLRRHEASDQDDRLSVVEKVAIRAEQNVNHRQHTGQSGMKTYHFNIAHNNLFGYSIRRAKLWLYVIPEPTTTPNTTNVLYISDTSGRNYWTTERSGVLGIVATRTEVREEGWLQLDVTDTVQRWLHHGHRHRDLSVTDVRSLNSNGRGAVTVLDTQEFTPFLMVKTNKPKKRPRRKTRNVCMPNQGCCRTPLRFNMREIRWESWLIHPPFYDAFYCRGSCSSLHVPQYAEGLRDYLQSRSSPHSVDPEIAPCCAAVEMSPISIIYMNENGNYINEELANMKVEACDCR